MKAPAFCIIEAGGVGYDVKIPLSTYKLLPDIGSEEKLLIYTIHREDNFSLYGFKTMEEKQLFEILLSVQGIGPKIALLILSSSSVASFKSAIGNQDMTRLTSISGIGKKKAEKLLFELKEKFKDFYGDETSATYSDIDKNAIDALVSLGYSKPEIMKVIPQIKSRNNLEEIIKEALNRLS